MQFFSWNRTCFRATAVLWLASAAGLRAAAADSGQRPPVILISIDTLRADHLGAYGYRRIATPNIDSIADGGTLFSSVACQTPLTLPSHTSLFTSTYPFENGIQENAEMVPSGAITLAGVLRSRGYQTAAFIGSVFLERQLGLDQGFDTYDSPFNFEAFSPLSGEMFFGGVESPYSVRDRRDGVLVVGAALRWMSARRGQPVFVFIHLFDLHTPYGLPADVARRKGISRYDAQLELVDGLIGRLKSGLAQSGWWDKSLTILLSDHGEGLGDHGESLHGYFIYQSTVHVPLVFHWPAGTAVKPARIERPAGLIDVAPTILGFLGVDAPPSFAGTSLLGAASHAVYSESLYTHDSFGWAALRSVRLGPFQYIEAPRPELYDLEKDPEERNNMVGADPGQANTLRTELANLLARYPRRAPAASSEATPQAQKLLSLGYLAPGPRTRLAGSGADPKDRLAEYRLYERSMDAVTHRRLNEAVALLTEILKQDSTNAVARRDLGSCQLDLHDYAKARANFEKLVVAAPDDYPSQFGLGMADKHLGLIDEARAHFEAACRIAPRALQCQRELDALKGRN